MIQDLEEKIRALPPECQREVEDFVDFLMQKQPGQPPYENSGSRVSLQEGGLTPVRKPSFEWAGALEHLRSQYTSVELQHAISNWRARQK